MVGFAIYDQNSNRRLANLLAARPKFGKAGWQTCGEVVVQPVKTDVCALSFNVRMWKPYRWPLNCRFQLGTRSVIRKRRYCFQYVCRVCDVPVVAGLVFPLLPSISETPLLFGKDLKHECVAFVDEDIGFV